VLGQLVQDVGGRRDRVGAEEQLQSGTLRWNGRLVEDAASASAVEVVLRGGRVVRVAAGFAAKTLREVVATLEDLPC